MARVRRSKCFRFRCSETELAELANAAAAARLTPTAFVRHALIEASGSDRTSAAPVADEDMASKHRSFRVSPKDDAIILAGAARDGLSVSDFVRRAVIGEAERTIAAQQPTEERKGEQTVRNFRINSADDAVLAQTAWRYGMKVGAFVRRAIRSAISQRPMLSPTETELVNTAIREFRQAARNLNALLRQTYQHASGLADNAPSADELRFMADDLQAAATALRRNLKEMPWGQV